MFLVVAGPKLHCLLSAHCLIGAYFLTTESDKCPDFILILLLYKHELHANENSWLFMWAIVPADFKQTIVLYEPWILYKVVRHPRMS